MAMQTRLPSSNGLPGTHPAIPHRWLLVLAMALSGTGFAQDLDPAFTPSFSDTVSAVAVQADGGIIVGGAFDTVNGQARYGLARLTAPGALDAAFPAGPDAPVLAIAAQPDGRVVIGGRFRMMGAAAHHRVARLLANGTLDPAFVSQVDNGATSEVSQLAVQSNDRIVIVGRFNTISGQPRDRLARLNADGSLDTGFNPPELGSAVRAMLIDADQRILLAGSFSDVTPACMSHCVIRLLGNGTLDPSFVVTPVTGTMEYLANQANSRILVGGSFGALGSHSTVFVGRLMANGGADTSFASSELRFSNIKRIIEQTDGRILIGGQMRWGTAGASEERIALLGSTGMRDTGFDEPVFDSLITSMALQSDHQIIVGGLFTSVDGIARNRLARFIGQRPDPIYMNGFD